MFPEYLSHFCGFETLQMSKLVHTFIGAFYERDGLVLDIRGPKNDSNIRLRNGGVTCAGSVRSGAAEIGRKHSVMSSGRIRPAG